MKYALATLFTIFLLAGTASGDIMPIGEASTASFLQGAALAKPLGVGISRCIQRGSWSRS